MKPGFVNASFLSSLFFRMLIVHSSRSSCAVITSFLRYHRVVAQKPGRQPFTQLRSLAMSSQAASSNGPAKGPSSPPSESKTFELDSIDRSLYIYRPEPLKKSQKTPDALFPASTSAQAAPPRIVLVSSAGLSATGPSYS